MTDLVFLFPGVRQKSTLQYISRPDRPKLAYRRVKGKSPGVVFLPGYGSNMNGQKAEALEEFCRSLGHACLRYVSVFGMYICKYIICLCKTQILQVWLLGPWSFWGCVCWRHHWHLEERCPVHVRWTCWRTAGKTRTLYMTTEIQLYFYQWGSLTGFVSCKTVTVS